MASDAGLEPAVRPLEVSVELNEQWRRLGRAATAVAVVTAPVAFTWFHVQLGWSVGWSVAATLIEVGAFRGLIDVTFRKFIPWPSLFGTDDPRLRQEDVMNRRRAWFWGHKLRWLTRVAIVVTLVFLSQLVLGSTSAFPLSNWFGAAGDIGHFLVGLSKSPQFQGYLFALPMLFFINLIILFGPMLAMGISQIRAFEPGDADWGVRLEHVRGQAEAKEEVRRIVSLWQSGEAFEAAGGKRERGLLFLGAPGTGKTMLAKAIATGFNSPFVTIPGSGFAQMFLGLDAIIVRYLAWKAKRLARKWGGTCIVFIDEIDAVGMRRNALAGDAGMFDPGASIHDHSFYGSMGALTSTGDLVLETRAWRDRLFSERAAATSGQRARFVTRFGEIVNQAFPGMMGGGGQVALNSLLVVMDGIDHPPFSRRILTSRLNTWLDALYVVPQRLGKLVLRLPPPRPRKEQIYFIGATNVPLNVLDPALTRPGRMGRHVWFRTPTKQDRLDIFNLYIGRVSHVPILDEPKKRQEIARVTHGYSPAMIEQVCSMALTLAHHEGREAFDWPDLIEAMATVESGTAEAIEYAPHETRAVAIHEAGHAACGHVFMGDRFESTRLSVRKRGSALGHHMAAEREERFTTWQHEEMGTLTWTLGSMAAEHVFYGENANGVFGDVQSATTTAGWMVGTQAMAPERVELDGRFASLEEEEAARDKIMSRFERIGMRIMNRAGGGMPGDREHNPVGYVLADPTKKALAAQILGQAFVSAYNFVRHNPTACRRWPTS